MDLVKTQFLVEDHITHTNIISFRRRRKGMLFKGGKPMRLMEWEEWCPFKEKWADEIAKDNVTWETVWVLEQVVLK